jgi:radical SAM superfamily enzyme with C-terminal helix-hairpin-helix motif
VIFHLHTVLTKEKVLGDSNKKTFRLGRKAGYKFYVYFASKSELDFPKPLKLTGNSLKLQPFGKKYFWQEKIWQS